MDVDFSSTVVSYLVSNTHVVDVSFLLVKLKLFESHCMISTIIVGMDKWIVIYL